MASSSGFNSKAVEGYLHDVSAVRQSQNSCVKYFDATLQEATKLTRVVVFSPNRHSEFTNAEKDRSPVQLSNVKLDPSRQKVGEKDVIVNDWTHMTCLKRKLDFCFDDGAQCSAPQMTLQEIITNPQANQEVTVSVKIVEVKECGTKETRYGPREITVYAVEDGTATMDLTVWVNAELELDRWYQCSRVLVKEYNQTFSLSSITNSTITVISDQGPVAEVESDVQEVTVNVMGATVKRSYFCPMRHEMEQVNEKTVCCRCVKCDMSYKSQVMIQEVSAEMLVKELGGEPFKVFVDNVVLREAVPLSKTSCDDHSLEAEICKHDVVHLTLRDKSVLAMQCGELVDGEGDRDVHAGDLDGADGSCVGGGSRKQAKLK